MPLTSNCRRGRARSLSRPPLPGKNSGSHSRCCRSLRRTVRKHLRARRVASSLHRAVDCQLPPGQARRYLAPLPGKTQAHIHDAVAALGQAFRNNLRARRVTSYTVPLTARLPPRAGSAVVISPTASGVKLRLTFTMLSQPCAELSRKTSVPAGVFVVLPYPFTMAFAPGQRFPWSKPTASLKLSATSTRESQPLAPAPGRKAPYQMGWLRYKLCR